MGGSLFVSVNSRMLWVMGVVIVELLLLCFIM